MHKEDDGAVYLRGKKYMPVAVRVRAFRDGHPIDDGWCIQTDIIKCDDSEVIIKAKIVGPGGRVVAEGLAEEKRSARGVNSTSALENCETSAIGRALAAAGYITSGQYASADEVRVAVASQERRDSVDKLFSEAGIGIDLVRTFVKDKGWGDPLDWSIDKAQRFISAVEDKKIALKV